MYWYKDRKLSWIDYFKSDEDLFYREAFDEEGKSTSVLKPYPIKKEKLKKQFK